MELIDLQNNKILKEKYNNVELSILLLKMYLNGDIS